MVKAMRFRVEALHLFVIFLVWKAFLLLIAVSSPGPGYDTSTALLGQSSSILADRLVRWDAIYYTKVAQRHYLFEQEWAFGWGFTRALKLLGELLFSQRNRDFPLAEALAGILLSHASHFISVLALYDMTGLLFDRAVQTHDIAYTVAILHIVSPGGLFLSGPCAEAFFSCLSFLAYNLYIRSIFKRNELMAMMVLQVAAALLFGISTTVRSNGLLNGLVFASDALCGFSDILRNGVNTRRIYKLAVTGACGSIVGAAYIVPQYFAFKEYCSIESSRPWCNASVPSIYNFVQKHYWNTGLLKYWTPSNAPLFVIGGPCIALFIISSWWAMTTSTRSRTLSKSQESYLVLVDATLKTLCLPQVALAGLVLSSYHVQIINRLSSGYPLWYWWLAKTFHGKGTPKQQMIARATVTWMVAYAAVQGALFANFLPPA